MPWPWLSSGQGATALGLHCGQAHGTVVLQAGHTDARHGTDQVGLVLGW